MRKVCVCGAFLFSDPSGVAGGGQGIKTRELAGELKRRYGNVYCIDTCGKNNKLLLFFRLFYALLICKNIIILPAHNGVLLETHYLVVLNYLLRRKLHYVVIGGWLQDFLREHKITAKVLHKFDGIYVETKTMFESLRKMGYKNIHIMNNFKKLNILKVEEMTSDFSRPYKLVYFARITEKKGLGEAVQVVNDINKEVGAPVYCLDIYGPIDEEDKEWFENIKKNFSNQILYKGEAPFEKSVDILKSYFGLLFPTKFYTEGIPGTIIDAYAAGIPVISSRWKSFSDVIEENVTGLGYEFGNTKNFKDLLIRIYQTPSILISLKNNCLTKALEYMPTTAIEALLLD